MTNYHKIFPAVGGLLMAATLPLGAQELRESVNVEGIYIQDFQPAEKIRRYPSLQNYNIGEREIPYSLDGVAATFSPSAPALPATVGRAGFDSIPSRGYLEFDMGSWLNAELAAGYRILRSPEQQLGVWLRHNSTSLWRPYGSGSDARFSYQELIGADYSRSFEGKGRLDAALQYHLGYFNYYMLDPSSPHPAGMLPGDMPTQTLNDASLRLRWSSQSEGANRWNVEAGGRIFNYRVGTREGLIRIGGGYERRWSQASAIGIDADASLLLYTGSAATHSPDNYGAICLNPYYEWHRARTRLRVGVDMDIVMNADGSTTDSHYSLFHIAPDIRFDLSARNIGFYIHLLGGSELQTLAAISQLDPYCIPTLQSTQPTYTPLDANIGIEIRPFSGFQAALNLRYKATRHVWMGGWFGALLNYGLTPMPGLDIPEGETPYYGLGLDRYDLSGLGASLKLSYSPSKILKVQAEGAYTPQRERTGIFNGLDRPRWVLKAEADVHPLRQLTIGIGYEYRGVRNIYTGYLDPDADALHPAGADASQREEMQLARLRLPDLTLLNLHAAWRFNSNLSISFHADNILNKRTVILPCIQGEGVRLSGGVQWLF